MMMMTTAFTPCESCELRKKDCFLKADKNELDFIESFKTRQLKLGANQTLFSQGEDISNLYTLKSGWAFRYKNLEDGSSQILNFLLPGDFIGLQARINGEIPYGVTTLTDCEFCEFKSDKILALYRDFPSLGYDLTWMVAHEELIVDENLISVGRRNASERIAMLLVSLYKRAQSVGEVDGRSFSFPITQQHIADALGLSLVHTNKTMAKLKKYGLYEMGNGKIKLNDLASVQKLTDYFNIPLKGRPLI